MAASDIIKKACDGALDHIRQSFPDDYAKLEADPAAKAKLIEAARVTATECVTLSKEFASRPEDDIAKRLAKHLSAERIKLIEGGLSIPTFRLDLIKKAEGHHRAEFTREGKQFLAAPRALTAVSDIDWTKVKQSASIIIEAVMLLLSAVGINISPGERVMEATVEDVAQAIESSSKLERAIEAFVEAWDAAGAGATAKAKALFFLIKDSYSAGILWATIKSLCSNMKWYDWLETTAKVAGMIIAALATDGVALIAEISLVVLSAVDFAVKIVNYKKLNDIKKNL